MEPQQIIECYDADEALQWEVVTNLDQIEPNLIYMTADGQEAHIEDLIEEDTQEAIEVLADEVGFLKY